MKRIISKLAIILALLFLSITETKSQQKDSIQIAPIPHRLGWNIQPLNYSYTNGVITILAGAKTDMYRDPNVTYNTDNAPKLLFEADVNFVFSAAIEHPFSTKWDGGALVLIEDSLNWIKFCFEKDYTGAKRIVTVVTRDISDDCNSPAIHGNKVFYKIAKADNVITMYYSTDGKKWFLIRHLQFNAKKQIKIGFLAQSPLGEKSEVKFSNIQYSTKKIKDPYLGEYILD